MFDEHAITSIRTITSVIYFMDVENFVIYIIVIFSMAIRSHVCGS
jgi:hypothetical protein